MKWTIKLILEKNVYSFAKKTGHSWVFELLNRIKLSTVFPMSTHNNTDQSVRGETRQNFGRNEE